MIPTTYKWLAIFTLLFSFVVVQLGAYTRLVDGGLGCPDWPGCYGQISVPVTPENVALAQELFPDAAPVEPLKAWSEMIHRYVAGTLVLCIMTLIFWGWRFRHEIRYYLPLSLIFVATIAMQATLGMWTVTWQLHPLIVMLHLVGGMTLASLLWILVRSGHSSGHKPRWLTITSIIALILVVLQIILGGWTSANYASLICTDFPTCLGSYWPSMDLGKAFTWIGDIHHNYQGGVLNTQARVAIQMMHRLGALIVSSYLVVFTLAILIRQECRPYRRYAITLLTLLVIQLALGIMNVVYLLPLPIAMAHNGVALLIALTTLTIIIDS